MGKGISRSEFEEEVCLNSVEEHGVGDKCGTDDAVLVEEEGEGQHGNFGRMGGQKRARWPEYTMDS